MGNYAIGIVVGNKNESWIINDQTLSFDYYQPIRHNLDFFLIQLCDGSLLRYDCWISNVTSSYVLIKPVIKNA